MEIAYSPAAQQDIDWWGRHGSPATRKKIKRLLDEMAVHPRTGTGKPELLKGDMAGVWSRRIDKKNRILYEIHDEIVIVYVLSMRGHYGDR